MLARLERDRTDAPAQRRDATRPRGRRALPVAAAIAAVAVAWLAAGGGASARLVKPTPPAVQPTQGRSFIPVQGDWEGTANGFAASFNLILDAVQRQRAGVPEYGIQDLVMLRPLACPPEAAHYGESVLGGRLPSVLGDHGALGLSRFGLEGTLTGARSATLAAPYSLPSCHGTLTWHMHPAVRRTVANGTWTVHYADGEHATFLVRAGGRLATAIRLPHSISGCNGLEGSLDVFIGVRGGSAVTEAGVTLRLRFSNGTATGTLSAAGCTGGPSAVTANHSNG
jgi:hypothetical protein